MLDRLEIMLISHVNLNIEGGETGSTEVKKLKLHAEVPDCSLNSWEIKQTQTITRTL